MPSSQCWRRWAVFTVICGTYTAETEKDKDGFDWSYFAVDDSYTGKQFNLGIGENTAEDQVVFFNENGDVVQGKYLTAAETIQYMASAANALNEAS